MDRPIFHENLFVAHLNRYATYSSEHESAFDEFTSHSSDIDSLRIETQTEKYILKKIQSGSSVSIILTGNAGDGKTYLCRKAFEAVTGKAFVSWQEASAPIPISGTGMTLRIVKDLSELGENEGAEILRELAESYGSSMPRSIFLIAANEGRLRALLTRSGVNNLYNEVDSQLRTGPRSDTNRLIVINLNSATTSTYVQHVLEWIAASQHWHACGDCPAVDRCPIRYNATRLAVPRVMKRLQFLLQVAEQLNEHITVRDMLIHLAFVTTGGLRCHEIIERRDDDAWRDQICARAYYENVFGTSADMAFTSKSTSINLLQRLDVGENSVFEIDDFVLNGDTNKADQKDYDQLFADGIDLSWRRFRQERDAYLRSGFASPNPDAHYPIMEWLPHCRRKLFFEWEREEVTDRLLPFLYVSQFFSLIVNPTSAEFGEVLKKLILGLNRAFSGLFLSDSASLYVTSQYAHAVEQPVPIVRFQISTIYISLEVEVQKNDYVDRSMATLKLIIPPPPRVNADALVWYVNLLMFEYLMRRARGSTPNILSNECELELRQLKDNLLKRFGSQREADSISFFAVKGNSYQLRSLKIGGKRPDHG